MYIFLLLPVEIAKMVEAVGTEAANAITLEAVVFISKELTDIFHEKGQ